MDAGQITESTTVPLALVVAAFSTLISIFTGIIAFLAKRNYDNDHKVLVDANRMLDARIVKTETALEQARSDRDSIREALHKDELTTMQIQGEIARVKDNHDALSSDVEEIKRTMVTKDLFEQAISAVKAHIQQVLSFLQRPPSGQMTRVPQPIPRHEPSDPPPRRGG